LALSILNGNEDRDVYLIVKTIFNYFKYQGQFRDVYYEAPEFFPFEKVTFKKKLDMVIVLI